MTKTLTEDEAFAASEAIARGDACPCCHQEWYTFQDGTGRRTLTHDLPCAYQAYLDALPEED